MCGLSVRATRSGAGSSAFPAVGLARDVVIVFTLVATLLVDSGCAGVRKTLAALQGLNTALEAQFGEPFSVNQNNTSGVLTLSAEVTQAEAERLTPESERVRAVRIAKFARTHYADTDQITTIAVIFTTRSDMGFVHVSRSYPGGTWAISSLDAEPDPTPVDDEGKILQSH